MDAQRLAVLLQLFVLLFATAGPLRIIPAYAGVATSLDPARARSLALRSVLIAVAAIVIAVLIGTQITAAWGVSREAVGAGAGLVLLLAALRPLVVADAVDRPLPDREPVPPAVSVACPIILPPSAVGIIILLSAFFVGDEMIIIGTATVLMAVNAICMIFAESLYRWMRPGTLRFLGAAFAVLQLLLAIDMIYWSFSEKFIP